MAKCCFSGYTTYQLQYYEKEDINNLKNEIKKTLVRTIEEGYLHYLCGFDEGSDLIFVESLLELKEQFPSIILQSVLPYEGQAEKWDEKIREKYFNLLSKCDRETVLQTHFDKNCFINRNKYMVNNSDMLITVHFDKLSNALFSLNYAIRLKKRVLCIDPNTYILSEMNPLPLVPFYFKF